MASRLITEDQELNKARGELYAALFPLGYDVDKEGVILAMEALIDERIIHALDALADRMEAKAAEIRAGNQG